MLAHVRELLLLALQQPRERSPQASEGSGASGGNGRGDRAPCNSNICGRDNTEPLWSDNLRPDLAPHRSLSHSVETRRPPPPVHPTAEPMVQCQQLPLPANPRGSERRAGWGAEWKC